MPTSSPLVIATNAVNRLFEELEYYQKDYAAQQEKIQNPGLADLNYPPDPENADFMKKQKVRNFKSVFSASFHTFGISFAIGTCISGQPL